MDFETVVVNFIVIRNLTLSKTENAISKTANLSLKCLKGALSLIKQQSYDKVCLQFYLFVEFFLALFL